MANPFQITVPDVDPSRRPYEAQSVACSCGFTDIITPSMIGDLVRSEPNRGFVARARELVKNDEARAELIELATKKKQNAEELRKNFCSIRQGDPGWRAGSWFKK